jgi:hypothetical protein
MSVRWRYQCSASATAWGSTLPSGPSTDRFVRMNEYPYTYSTSSSNARESWSLGMVRRLRAPGSCET